jgi:hypothetical protein
MNWSSICTLPAESPACRFYTYKKSRIENKWHIRQGECRCIFLMRDFISVNPIQHSPKLTNQSHTIAWHYPFLSSNTVWTGTDWTTVKMSPLWPTTTKNYAQLAVCLLSIRHYFFLSFFTCGFNYFLAIFKISSLACVKKMNWIRCTYWKRWMIINVQLYTIGSTDFFYFFRFWLCTLL